MTVKLILWNGVRQIGLLQREVQTEKSNCGMFLNVSQTNSLLMFSNHYLTLKTPFIYTGCFLTSNLIKFWKLVMI